LIADRQSDSALPGDRCQIEPIGFNFQSAHLAKIVVSQESFTTRIKTVTAITTTLLPNDVINQIDTAVLKKGAR
jgi:hypothetical protein